MSGVPEEVYADLPVPRLLLYVVVVFLNKRFYITTLLHGAPHYIRETIYLDYLDSLLVDNFTGLGLGEHIHVDN